MNGPIALPLLVGGYCAANAADRCVTCADEALPVRVIAVNHALALAQVEANGQVGEVDISLVDDVTVGTVLLIHGGVAIGLWPAEDS